MMYLGTLGRMVGIKCPTAQRVNAAGRYAFATTLGGAVKAQVGPVGRRVWDVSLGSLSTPSDVGTLMDFAAGGWGPGPFVFVPADAPVVNLLTPDEAACDPSVMDFVDSAELLGTPPLDLGADGVAARSVWTNGGGLVRLTNPVPVLPDTPMTGSAWCLGTGSLQVSFHDATGSQVGFVDAPVSSTAVPQRVAATAVTPPGAAYARLRASEGVTQVARPVMTWTNQPYEWGDGQRCDKAIVHNPTRDVTQAWDNPNTGRWSDLSFTVQEVG